MEGILSTRCLTPSSQVGTPTISYKTTTGDATSHNNPTTSLQPRPITPQRHRNGIGGGSTVLTPVSASSMLRALLLPIAASSPPPSPIKKNVTPHNTTPTMSSLPKPHPHQTSSPSSADAVRLDGDIPSSSIGVVVGAVAPSLPLTATTPKQLLEGLADRVDKRLATPKAASVNGGYFDDVKINRRTSTMSTVGSVTSGLLHHNPSTTTPMNNNGPGSINTDNNHLRPSTASINENTTVGGVVHRSPLRPASSSSSISSKKVMGNSQRVGSAMSLHKRNAQLLVVGGAKAVAPPPPQPSATTEDATTPISAVVASPVLVSAAKLSPPTTPPLTYYPLSTSSTVTPKGGHVRGFSGGIYLRSLDRLNTPAQTPTMSGQRHHIVRNDVSGVSDIQEEQSSSSAPITPTLRALTSLRPTTSSGSTSSKKVPISILNARKWRAERGLNEQDELDRLREERVQTAQAKREFDASVEPVSRRAIHTPAGGARRMYGAASLYSHTIGDDDTDLSDDHTVGVDPTPTTTISHSHASTASESNNNTNTTDPNGTISSKKTGVMASSVPSYLGDPQYTNDCSELAFDHVEWTPFLERCSLVAEEVVKRKKDVAWRRIKDVQTAAMQHMAIKESTSFWKRNPNPAEEIRRFKIQVGNGSKLVSASGNISISQNGGKRRSDILGSTTFQLTSPTSSTAPSGLNPTSSKQQYQDDDDFYLTTTKVSSTNYSHHSNNNQHHNINGSGGGVGENNKKGSTLSVKRGASFMKRKENNTRGAFLTEITKNPSGLSSEDAAKLEAYMRWSPMGSKGQHQFFNSRKVTRRPQTQKT